MNLIEKLGIEKCKQIVEACGGVEKVKQYLKDGNVFRFEETPLMKQAISDVESCQ